MLHNNATKMGTTPRGAAIVGTKKAGLNFRPECHNHHSHIGTTTKTQQQDLVIDNAA
jgi:hypothetical protein